MTERVRQEKKEGGQRRESCVVKSVRSLSSAHLPSKRYSRSQPTPSKASSSLRGSLSTPILAPKRLDPTTRFSRELDFLSSPSNDDPTNEEKQRSTHKDSTRTHKSPSHRTTRTAHLRSLSSQRKPVRRSRRRPKLLLISERFRGGRRGLCRRRVRRRE